MNAQERITRLRFAIRNRWEKNWPELRCALYGGLPDWVYTRNTRELGARVPVFCYHEINAKSFEADLCFLNRNHYVTVSADELLDHVQGCRHAPVRSVVLSIDDGTSSLFETAYPALQRYDMRAVAFVAPCFHVDDPQPMVGRARPCSWPEMEAMHKSGRVDFQSHTYAHRYVPRWPEPASIGDYPCGWARRLRGPSLSMAEDFRQARERLEQRLGKHVRHLAFPRYNGTPEAIRIGQACGYEGFWWGMLPHRPDNRPGDPATHVVRISGEFLRRLPGRGRIPLRQILQERYTRAARRWLR